MKKYLVLGGNGYIGKYIVEKLSENDKNNIVVADYNIDGCNDTENIKYKKIDFISCKDFKPYLEDVDVVIHLICTIVPNENIENINKEISDNVFPTVKLLDDMVKCNTGKIVFLSSGGTVYGEHDIVPIKEDEAKNPICNYGIVKLITEQYLALYKNNYDLNYSIVRLANPYSEKVKNGKKQGIIPIIIDQILNGQTINIWGDGKDIRDYIYMDDAIDAILKIIAYEGNENIFNVGTGIGYSINELLEIIRESLKIDNIDIQYSNSRKCDVKNNILNIDRIQECIDWKPQISLQSGISKVIESKTNGKNR